MKVKEFWDKFKELILVLAGIAGILTCVITYIEFNSKPEARQESPVGGKDNNVSDEQRKDIDSAKEKFWEKYLNELHRD